MTVWLTLFTHWHLLHDLVGCVSGFELIKKNYHEVKAGWACGSGFTVEYRIADCRIK